MEGGWGLGFAVSYKSPNVHMGTEFPSFRVLITYVEQSIHESVKKLLRLSPFSH